MSSAVISNDGFKSSHLDRAIPKRCIKGAQLRRVSRDPQASKAPWCYRHSSPRDHIPLQDLLMLTFAMFAFLGLAVVVTYMALREVLGDV